MIYTYIENFYIFLGFICCLNFLLFPLNKNLNCLSLSISFSLFAYIYIYKQNSCIYYLIFFLMVISWGRKFYNFYALKLSLIFFFFHWIHFYVWKLFSFYNLYFVCNGINIDNVKKCFIFIIYQNTRESWI